jgi:hypothetical protein
MGEFMEDNLIYAGGAKRSEKMVHYRDISHSFLRRVGAAFLEGSEKYEKDLPVGAKNWKKGDKTFALDVFDHAIAHLYELKEQALDGLLGDPNPFVGEDHLGHLGANLVMIDFFQSKGFYALEDVEAKGSEEPFSPDEVLQLPATQDEAQGITARILDLLTGGKK